MTADYDPLTADYITETGLIYEKMRLIIEGGFWLYNEETSQLLRLAREHDQHALAETFSTIGTAIYELHTLICDLQKRYTDEIKRQIAKESP